MNWTCTQTNERLSDYLDGALGREEAESLMSHAAGCAHCGPMVQSVTAVVRKMQDLGPVAEPPRLSARILDSTLGPRREKAGWKRWFSIAPRAWPRFAMGAVTVAATFVIVLHTSGIAPKKLRKTNLNPVDAFRSANRQAHLVYARSAKFVNDLRVVYEIQSKLQPEPEPPAKNPQEKSQTEPNRGRSQIRSTTMYAFALPLAAVENLSRSAQ